MDLRAQERKASDRDESRADWMELFFDLVFVALVGQLASGVRTDPSFTAIFIFLALFASVWWSWVNLTYTVSVQIGLSRRTLSGYMLAAMACVGAIAVAAPDAAGDRAWLFALGNAALRCVMLLLWTRRSWTTSRASRVRVLFYNGATAAVWLASAFVPAPICFVLWAFAVVVEATMLFINAPGLLRQEHTLNPEHLTDRFGALVIITLGESVLAVVLALSEQLTPGSAGVAICALIVMAGIAWTMFIFGIDSMRSGLERLSARGDARGLVETFAFLPFLLVAGLTLLAGALSSAVLLPEQTLPFASAVSLGAGVAMAYTANALTSLRYRVRPGLVLAWALPAVLLPLLIVPLAVFVPAGWAVAAMAGLLVLVVALSEARHRAHVNPLGPKRAPRGNE